MKDGKIIVARLWPTFAGNVPFVVPVISGLNPQKFETIGIYLTKTSDIPNLLEQSGKKVFYISDKPKLPLNRPKAFLKFIRILKEQKVDILHCDNHKTTFHGTIGGKFAGVPVIISHVHGLGRTRNLNRRIQNYFLMPHIDKIFAVGQAVKEDIEKNNPSVSPDKVINIGNAVDYEYFANAKCDRNEFRKKYNIPQDSFLFATAGRLAQTKGQKYLIEAFAKIKNQIPNISLICAGRGELKEELENRAAELGCKDSVFFPGKIENMREFYCGIDCFVLPSIAEGLPRTLLEAMSSGVLSIASDVGGIPEILENGKLDLLVPAKNADILADAMLKAFNMPRPQKESFIAESKEHVKKNYSLNTMIERFEKNYDELFKLKN
jgi:glycosyltransferase involved in cell wall biosynthesis